MQRIGGYLLWAFGISWGLVGIGFLLGVRSAAHPFYIAVAALCMLGPALAAIIQQRTVDRAPWQGLGLQPKGTRWGIVAITALVAICIVPLYFLLISVLGNLAGVGEVSVTTERFLLSMQEAASAAGMQGSLTGLPAMLGHVPGAVILAGFLLVAVITACTFNLPFMLGEELGWRGYLVQHTRTWNGLRRVLFTGLVWGLWHAPLIALGHNYPGHPITGIGLMVVFCTVLAFLFDWTRMRSGSIWSACLLHGVINGSAGASVMFAWGGHPLIGSIAGLVGCAAIALVAVVVVTLDGTYRRSLLTTQPV